MWTCGMVMFSGMTQLDLTGPYEVLAKVEGMRCMLLAATREAVRTEHGMKLLPEETLEGAPRLDILFVPGGPGVNEAMNDERVVGFLKGRAGEAMWITSVCTGSLVLGAAGLLRGYRATTHWRSMEFLRAFGAIPVEGERVVVDRDRITAAGVSTGIEMGLVLAERLAGREEAMGIQLRIEYDPDPPLKAGHPRVAPAEVVERVKGKMEGLIGRRAEAVRRAMGRMG